MKTASPTDYTTRDSILKLLSDAETAKLSTAEAAASLTSGDEYLDLEQLFRGIQRAGTTPVPTPMGRVLPRKAVQPGTWSLIVSQLGTPTPGAPAKKA